MTVYDAKRGKCKWADVYVKTNIHFWLYVEGESGLRYTAETSALQGMTNWERVIFTRSQRYPGGIIWRHFRTSEDVGRRWANIIQNMRFFYLDPRLGGCIGFAEVTFEEMRKDCP